MIIFGTKGRITSPKEKDNLPNACPQCGHDLDLSELKRWFTLYFIPLFPYSHVDTFYYCKECEASYKQDARAKLLGGKAEQEQLRKEAANISAVTLVSCMTYMSNIDGEISHEEDQLIQDAIRNLKDNSEDLVDAYNKVKNGTYKKDDIYSTLRKASEILTTEGILMLIAELARMVLADGKIDKEEERLMKSFMLVCGVSEDLYGTIMDKVKS